MPDTEHIFVYQEWDWMRERPNPVEERLERAQTDAVAPANPLSSKLQKARIEHRMSIHDLAQAVNLPVRRLTLYENGTEVPSGDAYGRLKQALNL